MYIRFQAQYRRILSCRCMADTPSPRFGQQLQAHKKMNGGNNTNNLRSGGGLLHQRQAQSCRIPMAMTRYNLKAHLYKLMTLSKILNEAQILY
jgi:hypothetical protein